MTDTTTAPSRRKLLTRDQRRAAIVHSAAQAFAHTGYAATSMEQVAKASGVTKLILYRNFESKEALYRAVLDAVSSRLAEVYLDATTSSGRPAGARAMLTAAREEPDGFVLLWRHASREEPFADYARDVRDVVVALTRQLISPRFEDDPTLLDWAADAMVAWIVDAVLSWLEHGEPARDEEFLDLAARSIRSMLNAWATA